MTGLVPYPKKFGRIGQTLPGQGLALKQRGRQQQRFRHGLKIGILGMTRHPLATQGGGAKYLADVYISPKHKSGHIIMILPVIIF
jgi:hypothetical protein